MNGYGLMKDHVQARLLRRINYTSYLSATATASVAFVFIFNSIPFSMIERTCRFRDCSLW